MRHFTRAQLVRIRDRAAQLAVLHTEWPASMRAKYVRLESALDEVIGALTDIDDVQG